MLQDVFIVFEKAFSLFQIEFVIYGFPLSVWDIFIWTALVGIVGAVIWRFLDG